MIDDEETARARGRPRSERAEPPKPHQAAITPDDAPSALERGARIFERLQRRRP